VLVIVWEFQVAGEHESAFEAAYNRDGAWVALFKRGDGFVSTELLRDAQTQGRYLTVDRWRGVDEYDAFLRTFRDEYEALDQHCAGWTLSESLIGRFHP
jgi:heme-degrading monooxygenase HmoA